MMDTSLYLATISVFIATTWYYNRNNVLDYEYQKKQKELLAIQQKIKQAGEELESKQAAVMMVSVDTPRDIRTEIFNHINLRIRVPEDKLFIRVYLAEDRQTFTMRLQVSTYNIGYYPVICKIVGVDMFIKTVENYIQDLTTIDCGTIAFSKHCTHFTLYNQDKRAGYMMLNGKTSEDFKKSLSLVVQHTAVCMKTINDKKLLCRNIKKHDSGIKIKDEYHLFDYPFHVLEVEV